MPKEKPQLNNQEAQSLAMARRTLGRVKEMELTPDEKEKVMAMIDEAKALEKNKNLAGALRVYNELLRSLKENEMASKMEATLVDYGGYQILYPQVQVLQELAANMVKTSIGMTEKEAVNIILDNGLEVDEDGNIILIKLYDKNIESGDFLTKLPKLQMELGEYRVLYRQFCVLYEIQEKLVDIKLKTELRTDSDEIWEIIEAGINTDSEGNITWLKINLFALTKDEDINTVVKKGLITIPDLSALTKLKSLDLHGNLLASLPDLRVFTGLESLDIGSNNLAELPDLSALTQLKAIEISKNPFKVAPDLGQLKNLEDLTCDYCPLIPDISALTKLRILWCTHNNLTVMPDISHLAELELLVCADNELASLPDLSGFKNLKNLNCIGNHLESLPKLSALKNLVQLHCGKNKLKKLPDLSELTKLKELNCPNNELEFLPDLSNLINLERVTCYNNKLSDSELEKIHQQVPIGCKVFDTEATDEEEDEEVI